MFPWDKPEYGKSTYHRVTHQEVQSRMEKQRANEQMLDSFALYNKGDSNIRVANQIENNAATRRIRNDRAAVSSEILMDSVLRQQRQELRETQRRAEQDRLLAEELERRQLEEDMRRRDIQRICEEDEELRDLQEKLKVAYINRERSVQVHERESLQEVQKARAYQEFLEAEEKRRRECLYEQEKERQRRLRQVEGKHEIESQIEEKEIIRRQEAAIVAAKEKEEIDRMVAQILEQDRATRREHSARQQLLKSFMEQCLKEREEERSKRRDKEKEEWEKLLEYQKIQDERDREIVERKDRLKAQKEALYQRLMSQAKEKMREEEEIQNYKDILYFELEEKHLREMDRQRAEQKRKMMEDMQRANEEMQSEKKQRLAKEREEEEKLSEMMKAKFEADLQREREEFEMRQREKLEYRGHISDQIKKKQELYRQELEMEIFEREQNQKREDFKKRVVEEARRRLLEEHAKPLGDYLPKGVFNTKEELASILP